RETNGRFRIPLPRHEMFIDRDYRYPFVKSRRFATVMTEFGCPFHCAFCVMGTLGCKRRPIEDVIEELLSLRSLGIRDIFFLDQSFGSDRSRNLALCEAIGHTVPEMRWLCFSRVDLVDETVLSAMKSAGCHSIIFGVETANAQLLETYRKGYSLDQVRSMFAVAQRLKIRTVATFLLGLPGETRESAMETIEFARRLPCNFASLNVAVPRMGTDLRQWAVTQGYVNESDRHFDQSGSRVIMQTESLTSAELAEIKRIAVRRLYLNPSRIWRILISIQSWNELLIQVREGICLLQRFMRSRS
ncbi:radical SAM protein, partial [bacterium]|nr:radical SAM protein [candidate division CSSED10-310 bacterium]